MKLIPLTEIQVTPERQRREFPQDYLNELKESIQEDGLFNAVVLRPDSFTDAQGEEDNSWLLVQGECRLRAIADIYALGGTFKYDGEPVPPGMVPYTTLGDLNPLLAAIAEFHENTKRRDLTWQERAAATAGIMRLRTELACEAGAPLPTIADISREVRDSAEGFHHETTRREIILAEALDDPEIKASKTVNDAWKVLKKKEDTARNIQLAETVGRTFTADLHQILNEDALAWLERCPEGQFDVLILDPPYGMNADQFGDAGGAATSDHGYDDSDEAFDDICQSLDHLYRVAKPQAHLYLFCDIDRFYDLRAMFSEGGSWGSWWVHRTPMIWHKPNGNRTPWPEHGPQRKYELILYAVKGKRPTATQNAPDIIPAHSDENLGNSAQKPVALYRELLRRSAKPGDKVLDCFAGTGPLIVAAHEAKCIATLVEKDPGQYGIILKRAQKLKGTQEELPV